MNSNINRHGLISTPFPGMLRANAQPLPGSSGGTDAAAIETLRELLDEAHAEIRSLRESVRSLSLERL